MTYLDKEPIKRMSMKTENSKESKKLECKIK